MHLFMEIQSVLSPNFTLKQNNVINCTISQAQNNHQHNALVNILFKLVKLHFFTVEKLDIIFSKLLDYSF